MLRLVLPTPLLSLDQLESGATTCLPIAILYVPGGVELLAYSDASPDAPYSLGSLYLRSINHDTPWERPEEDLTVVLWVDAEADPILARGEVYWGRDATPEPLDELRLVGEGMRDISLHRSHTADEFDFAQDERLSRVVGAVGGRETLDALAELRVAVMGCGGLGSVAAEQLARLMGPLGHLDLFDPDTLEPWNLPAWLSPQTEPLGNTKVEALAAQLHTLPNSPTVTAHVLSLCDDSVQALLKRDQLFVCCVDSPCARLRAGFFATIYARPLLIIETGVFFGTSPAAHARLTSTLSTLSFKLPARLEEPGPRLRLADVRLLLPEPARCVLCMGGVGGSLAPPPPEEPFWRHRLGSLMPLNLEAIGRGVRLFLGWFSGEVTASTHLRFDEPQGGLGTWQTVPPSPRRNCPLCALQGRGDSARHELGKILDFGATL